VAAAGCDNVEWAGSEVHLQPPPPVERAPGDTLGAPGDDERPPPPLPEGPVLFMGTRSGPRVTLRPVAELRGDTLVPLLDDEGTPGFLEHFRTRRLAAGAEFTLFAGGVRVGTLMADTSAVIDDACRARVTVSGLAELTLAAANATRFLALPRDQAPPGRHDGFVADAPGAEEAAISLNLASRVIMREEAYWPDNLGQARASLHRIPLAGTEGTGVAATFLFRDRLAVEPPESPVAYSLFVLGSGGAEGNSPAWDWYREVERDGKGAPRHFETADWDGDGDAEILLEVFGDQARWVAALDLRNGRWERVFEESCAPRMADAQPDA
jgi:hypothetical protein